VIERLLWFAIGFWWGGIVAFFIAWRAEYRRNEQLRQRLR
jgi:hypothetical protein